jgi:hypothetical protein
MHSVDAVNRNFDALARRGDGQRRRCLPDADPDAFAVTADPESVSG